MRKGDISATPAPRLVFVWEGLVARLPGPAQMRKRDRYLRKGRWAEAIEQYVTDARMSARILHLFWNYDFGLDLVTYLPEDVLPALKERVNRERMPFGWVTAETPDGLASRVGWDQAVGRVLDGDQSRALRYGPKGRYVADAGVEDLLA